MTDYVREIQRQLVERYHFPADGRGLPQGVPDGDYPMEINGRLDRVRVEGGYIRCCRFDGAGEVPS
jgi:hypothetical protein